MTNIYLLAVTDGSFKLPLYGFQMYAKWEFGTKKLIIEFNNKSVFACVRAHFD